MDGWKGERGRERDVRVIYDVKGTDYVCSYIDGWMDEWMGVCGMVGRVFVLHFWCACVVLYGWKYVDDDFGEMEGGREQWKLREILGMDWIKSIRG